MSLALDILAPWRPHAVHGAVWQHRWDELRYTYCFDITPSGLTRSLETSFDVEVLTKEVAFLLVFGVRAFGVWLITLVDEMKGLTVRYSMCFGIIYPSLFDFIVAI
jgi:hypothetical protein